MVVTSVWVRAPPSVLPLLLPLLLEPPLLEAPLLEPPLLDAPLLEAPLLDVPLLEAPLLDAVASCEPPSVTVAGFESSPEQAMRARESVAEEARERRMKKS
jgi:hypothetical protein